MTPDFGGLTLTFDLSSSKLAFYLLMPWGTFVPFLIFLRFFVFELSTSTGQTDGRTHGRARRIMRPVGPPHNNMITCVKGVLERNISIDYYTLTF